MSEAPNGAKILPFYLVVDVSYSMSGERIDAVNMILPKLADTLARNPILSDKVRFGVLDFADDAQLLLPSCDLLEQSTLPPFVARGGTNYTAAFRELRQQITSDVIRLKQDGFMVHRPAVFFMSDGEPTSADWPDAFTELTFYDGSTNSGFPYYPNVIPFGIEGADPTVLQKLIHPATGSRSMKMYLTDKGHDAGDAISAMAEVLVASVLLSGNGVESGNGGVILPDDGQTPDGVTPIGPNDPIFL